MPDSDVRGLFQPTALLGRLAEDYLLFVERLTIAELGHDGLELPPLAALAIVHERDAEQDGYENDSDHQVHYVLLRWEIQHPNIAQK